MKTYDIYDQEESRSVGTLLYYEKEKSVIIELQENLDEWSAPLLFTALVKKQIYTVPKDTSFIWVKERVIPNSRQNISSILKNHKLKQYDEMKLLELSEGRCSQDSLYIKKINEIPEYVQKRQLFNLTEVVPLDDFQLLCFFNNEEVKKSDLKKIADVKGIDKILKFDQIYKSGKAGTGGYSVSFNDSIDIPAKTLYDIGTDVPLTLSDFECFVRVNTLDTTESCRVLGCSRQNISYMLNNKLFKPVKDDVHGNLYLKGDILKNMW